MAKLYTRKGDDGNTNLLGGSSVSKDDTRVEAYGTVDELNAQLGVAASLFHDANQAAHFEAISDRMGIVQGELFEVGAELARPKSPGNQPQNTSAISPDRIARMESWIDEADAIVPPLKRFILPGGNRVAAHLHVCRALCRRAERRVVTLASRHPINPHVPIYLNRLSDLLFVWARLTNHFAKCPEQTWPKGDD